MLPVEREGSDCEISMSVHMHENWISGMQLGGRIDNIRRDGW
jgi:hypothetical protein